MNLSSLGASELALIGTKCVLKAFIRFGGVCLEHQQAAGSVHLALVRSCASSKKASFLLPRHLKKSNRVLQLLGNPAFHALHHALHHGVNGYLRGRHLHHSPIGQMTLRSNTRLPSPPSCLGRSRSANALPTHVRARLAFRCPS